MKKVALIGGGGFIGINFLEQMSTTYDLTVFGRKAQTSLSLGEYHINYLTLEVNQLSNQLAGFDIVVNLASAKVKPDTPLSEYLNEIDLANQLMLACIDCQTKFVQLSSRGVYDSAQSVPWSEQTKTLPNTYYSISKLAIDHLLQYYNLLYGTKFVSLRLAQVYGLLQGQIDPSQETFVVMRFISLALQSGDLPVFGSGMGARDYVYIDDVVQAIQLAVESEEAGIFNIGSGQMVSYLDLARMVAEVFNPSSKLTMIDAPEDKSHVMLDITKANQRLGYYPKYTMIEGLKAMKDLVYEPK